MKKKSLSIILAIALTVVQFSVLTTFTASATTYSALTGRDDFMFGVNIRGNNLGSSEYSDTYQAVIDAKSLGSQIIRVKNGNLAGSSNINYFSGLADIASQKGIELMFMECGIHEWVLKDDGTGNDKMPCTLDEVDEHKDDIINYYTEIATAYKDKVQYYQIGNEMDAESKSGGYLSASNANSGRTESQFVDLRGIALGICLAQEAIKAVDPDAKIIVNTSWKDSGFIIKLKSYYYDTVNQYIYTTDNGANRVPVAWDYTGLDFYAQSTSLYSDYSGVVSDLTDLSEPVMIVEAGLTPVVSGDTVSFCGDADWLATFAQDMYSNSKVKGFINFELYDNVSHYGSNNRESYHGLIDYNGNKRPEYSVMQTLFGGTDVVRPSVGSVDSSSELLGFSPEYLDETIHELNMYKIFSSGEVSNIFFTDDVSASINKFGDSTVLEFDMFVEDAAAFRAALDTSERTWFVALFGPNNTARYALELPTTLIAKNGWNHIAVTRAQFDTTAGNIDLTGNSVTNVKIGYKENSNYTNPASGLKLAFANFCLTSINPPMADVDPGFVIYEGAAFQGTFGNTAISGQGHLPGYSSGSPAQKTFAAGSVADYSIFEFDFYLDDISIIAARNTKLYLNLRSGSGSGTSRGIYEFQDQLTANGWNHIRVKTDLAADKLEILTMARFYIDIDASETGATDHYRVANIFATSDPYSIVPAMPSVSPGFDIYEGAAFAGTFGSTAITGQGHLPGYSPAQKTFAAGSTADYSCFEFDFYLDDISIITARNTKLYLNLRSGSGNGTSRGIYEFQNQLTANGWNHIKVITDLADDKLEILTMARFYIDIDAGSAGATDRYRIANICATLDTYNLIPDVTVTPRYDVCEGAALQGTFGSSAITGQGHLPGYSPAQKTFAAGSVSGCDCFEFDFYLDDVSIVSARNVKLYLNLRSGSGSGTSRGLFEFQNQLTANGWNHVKVITDLADDKLEILTMARFYIDIDAGDTGATDRYRVANICAVKTIEILPEYPLYASAEISATGVKDAWGSQFNDVGDQLYFSVSSVDISNAEYIEFDVFIKNSEAFHSAFDGKSLRFCIGSDVNRNNNRRAYDFVNQIISDGWNHIVIDIASFASNTGTDLSSIKTAGLSCFGSGLSDANPISGTNARIVNVCAVNNLRNINDFGSSEVSNTYKNDYTLSLAQSAAASLDFTGATAIEFDMYVEDYDTFVESFKTDAAGQAVDVTLRFGISTNASYSESVGYYRWTAIESKITHTGWNHVTLPILEKSASRGSYNDVDTLTGIGCWRMWYGGDAYKDGTYTNRIGAHTVTVKNVCATIDSPLPSITVGKDQSEVYVTWFVGSSDYVGAVMLKNGDTVKVIGAYEHAASATSPFYYNRAKITGLESDTEYEYKVGYAGVWSAWYPLKTGTFSNSFSFVQVSDVQLPNTAVTTNNWKTTLSAINQYLPNTSFIMNTGDVVDTASKLSLYNLYKSPDLLKGYVTSVIPGNHDETDSAHYASSAYNESFTVPTDTRELHTGNFENTCDYWYSYNNVLFIALVSTIQDNAYHEAFVRRVISEQGNRFKWKIVQCHYSLFSGSYHNNEGNVVAARNALAPVFSELGIDLVLSGHDHKYLRSYIMNGTAPVVSDKSYAGNTNGGVQYISCTTPSGIKFNNTEEKEENNTAGYLTYTAYYLGPYDSDQINGFMNYEVTDYSIKLTYYSSADMSVLDEFTIYKVNTLHISNCRLSILQSETFDAVDYNYDTDIDVRDYVRLKNCLAKVA